MRDIEIIFGKWIGISIMVFFLFLPLWVYPFLAKFLELPLAYETYLSGFLGLLLLAFFFASVGLFISSLFESQTASAVMAVGLLVIFWSLEGSQSFQVAWVGKILSVFSVQKYLQPFFRGIVTTQNILFFVSGITFFLFLTFRSLEKRSYRNPL